MCTERVVAEMKGNSEQQRSSVPPVNTASGTALTAGGPYTPASTLRADYMLVNKVWLKAVSKEKIRVPNCGSDYNFKTSVPAMELCVRDQ